MKFIVPNYSCLQNPRLGGYRPQIPTEFVEPPPPRTKFLGTPLVVEFAYLACTCYPANLQVAPWLWARTPIGLKFSSILSLYFPYSSYSTQPLRH